MDTISITQAGEIDTEWFNNGMQPNKGLRVVNHYASGGRSVSILEVPGDDSTPVYRRVNGHFQHVAGPTLADWRNAQIALDNAARYEAQAADSKAQAETLPEPHRGWANSNAALFADKASFYRSQAAQIAGR